MAYVKEVFDVKELEHAKHIVLTSDPNNPNKFKNETDAVVKSLKKRKIITKDSWVMDFGCGMGRVSKALLDEFNCTVIGVDISPSMLNFAQEYTESPKFKGAIKWSIPNTMDVCLAILCIQHTEYPKKEIQTIYEALKLNGYLVLINENNRLVPSGVDSSGFVIWNDDGFNVHKEVEKKFKKIHAEKYMDTDKEIIYYQKVT
jgi:SAM-dependent methyltransferase